MSTEIKSKFSLTLLSARIESSVLHTTSTYRLLSAPGAIGASFNVECTPASNNFSDLL